MKRIYILVLMLLVIATPPLYAQKRQKATVKVAPKTAVQIKAEKAKAQKIEQMTNATQKVVFIDSIVVSKKDFLGKYRLNPESGSIYPFNSFFKVNRQPNSYVYVNELGNKSYYSVEDSVGNMELFTSDYDGTKWSNPKALPGLDANEGITLLNYPYMMADGVTLYFAAKGEESIGGYDIFVTRFDSERGEFLKPENIGMPFNSPANDYMLAIDELDNIGWFATDRNQTAGNVCIYIFIPTATRQTYAEDHLQPEQLKRLAQLHSIADTWGDGKQREEAMQRLRSIPLTKADKIKKPDFVFVINNNTIYTKLDDFKTEANKARFKQLQKLQSNLSTLEQALEQARNFYASANKQDKKALTSEILQSEQQTELLEQQIKQLEKDIRNNENNNQKQ